MPIEHPSIGAVCEACWSAVQPLTPPLCDTCGDPLRSWHAPVHLASCPHCRRRRRTIDRARAVGKYDGVLRDIIHAFKYGGRRSIARPLARLMERRGHDVLDGADAVVPVPLHWSRRRSRGFNQATDLARHLGTPVVEALCRVRATPTQTDLPSSRRHQNVQAAFAATRAGARLSGALVVLVDDVSTTGATLEACGRALKDAGVREVRALTAARVVTERR
jgi:ComF family protein